MPRRTAGHRRKMLRVTDGGEGKGQELLAVPTRPALSSPGRHRGPVITAQAALRLAVVTASRILACVRQRAARAVTDL